MFKISEFKERIDNFYNELTNVEGDITEINPSENKWSLKEIVGHLVDSASNNHQRFIRMQFGDLIDFPAYDGEKWIKAENYNGMDWEVLIALWYSYNILILNLIGNVSEASLENVWIKDEKAFTLEELIHSYYEHIDTHIGHFRGRVGELEI